MIIAMAVASVVLVATGGRRFLGLSLIFLAVAWPLLIFALHRH